MIQCIIAGVAVLAIEIATVGFITGVFFYLDRKTAC